MAPPSPSSSLYGFFGRGGRLQQVHPGYEYRRAQLEMADAVETALDQHRHLLVEAGTGTGKTLAYLVPAIRSGRRVMISTGTRHLQEQLVYKDVPLLEKAIGRRLKVVCMKGRGNYACRQKIKDLEAQPHLVGLEAVDAYLRIHEWARSSETGDRAELDFLPEHAPLWEHLNARRETCTGQKCPMFDACFLTALHQKAAEAELVVVNHHLFFADLMLKQQDLPGVLPPYEAVIFDEAHELESVAGQYFGVASSNFQIDELTRDTEATLLVLKLTSAQVLQRSERLRQACTRLLSRIGDREGRFPFDQREQFLEEHSSLYDDFMLSLQGLRNCLETMKDKPEEVFNLIRRCDDQRTRFAYLLESRDPSVVYWYERRGSGIYLQATPIHVAQLLQQALFGTTDTAVLTSATLAVDGGFEYVRGRLGIDNARELVVPSPFRYREQALLYIAADLPDPRAEDFVNRAAEEIQEILHYSAGRAFVLSTSHEQMRELHMRLETKLPFPVYLQGEAPRHVLLEKFRSTPNAVLFATSSFWQGVDVQGEQLSCVIIDRLPFASPGDPVVAARIRALQQERRNAFLQFQIPEAVLALKQGFGRLIRASSDRGVVVLLDNRVLRQRYGAHFLDSLPPYRRTTSMDDVRQFFAPQETEPEFSME